MTSELNEQEARALAAIDMEGLLAYLDEIVSLKSLDGEETAVQQNIAQKMRTLGLEVDEWQIDFEQVRQHPAYCEEVIREEGVGVVGIMGNGNGKSLILNGHTDVVPAGEPGNWTVDPWRVTVKDGNVYGRGALDMKGGLVCAIFAAKAILDADIELDGKLLIQAVIGEEDGGIGTLATCLRGYSADAAIIMEPTELMVAPAQAGCLNFRITIPGYAAHGAVRLEGHDPIAKFIPIFQAIMNFEAERNATIKDPRFDNYELPYPICIGTIQAGNWASTVAESLTFEGRYGVAVEEIADEARRQFTAVVHNAAQSDPFLRKHPPKVEWWGGQFESAGIDPEHEIVQTVSEAFTQLTGKPPIQQGMTYGADMRLLVRYANTPTIMFGAGDVRKAHQPDEYVPLAELETLVKTLTLTILRMCG